MFTTCATASLIFSCTGDSSLETAVARITEESKSDRFRQVHQYRRRLCTTVHCSVLSCSSTLELLSSCKQLRTKNQKMNLQRRSGVMFYLHIHNCWEWSMSTLYIQVCQNVTFSNHCRMLASWLDMPLKRFSDPSMKPLTLNDQTLGWI